MTSPDHKVGQILKLIFLHQYLSNSVDQKLKMSEMLIAILLVCSTSGITSGEKVCRELKMAAILKFWYIKYRFNLMSDMKRSSQIMPKKFFWWWWRHRFSKWLTIYVTILRYDESNVYSLQCSKLTAMYQTEAIVPNIVLKYIGFIPLFVLKRSIEVIKHISYKVFQAPYLPE